MKKKPLVIATILAIITVVGSVGFFILRAEPTTSVMAPSTPVPSSTNATAAAQQNSPASSDKNKTFTLTELAQHNTAKDCYIAYGGQVFDITWFIPRHEGGDQIIQVCGTATDDFSKIHPGGPFTKRAVQAVLQMSVVGKLAQ